MQPLKVELRKVKIHPDMSEETTCFSSEVWVNGQLTCYAQNRGHGGCNMYNQVDKDLFRKLKKYAKKNMTEFDFEHLDQLIDKLLARSESEAQIRKWCKKKMVMKLKHHKKGEWSLYNKPYTLGLAEGARKHYGKDLILIANEDIAKAVELDI